MTETARLGWVIAYVPDVEAAVAFYEKAFGLARRFVVDDYGELDTGATTLAFAAEDLGRTNFEGGVQRPGETPFNVEIALVFDDVDGAFARAVESGAVALAEPADKSHGQRVGFMRDPFGNLLEIATPLA